MGFKDQDNNGHIDDNIDVDDDDSDENDDDNDNDDDDDDSKQQKKSRSKLSRTILTFKTRKMVAMMTKHLFPIPFE